jgi:hypothetical protein
MLESFHVANVVLTLLFAVEVVAKLGAYTFAAFWSDAFNIFDFLIVFFGLLELLSDLGISFNAFRTFRIFRLFRVLRVMRMISFLAPLKVVFAVIMRTLTDLFSIIILLFLFLFIFAILGMQIFGGLLGVEEEMEDGTIYVARCDFISLYDGVLGWCSRPTCGARARPAACTGTTSTPLRLPSSPPSRRVHPPPPPATVAGGAQRPPCRS